MTIDAYATTDRGLVRSNNEDCFALVVPGDDGPNPWGLRALLAVADGMGGHEAGELASASAIETVTRGFFETAGTRDASLDDLSSHMGEVIRIANDAVFAIEAGDGTRKCGTTLTCLAIRDGYFVAGHVGDSRAYLIRSGHIQQITEDDSWVADLVKAGQMTSEEARISPMRNQITKSIGIRPEVNASVSAGVLREGDLFVLCSDGITEHVSDKAIERAAVESGSAKELCAVLVREALDGGGEDNVTVVTALVGDRPAPTRRSARDAALAEADTSSFTSVSRPDGRLTALRRPKVRIALLLAALVALFGAWMLISLQQSRPESDTRPAVHSTHRSGDHGVNR